MKTYKKLALLCLSLLATLAITAGCNMGNSGTSNSSSSSEISSVNGSSQDESSENTEDSSDDESNDGSSSIDDYSSEENSSSDDSSSEESSSSDDSSSEENSSSEDNSSSDDSSNDNSSSDDEKDPDEDLYKDVVIPTYTLTDDCVCGDWKLIKAATCTEDGAMIRVCTKDATHMEAVAIDAKGHDYGNNGLCACGETPDLPSLPSSGYVNITKSESGIHLSQSSAMGNEMYNRYVLTTDQLYTAETVEYTYIDNETFETITEYSCWIQFSIPETGQYAVISKSNPYNLTISRYDASAHYVNPKEWAGGILDDGNFISTVSVNDVYFNDQWLTACCIKGTQPGQTVDFSIVRIDDAAWAPKTIYEHIEATDINGVKAPDGATGTKPTEVPYDTDGIYFDETKGYYCMPDGSLIYAAITMKASRQFIGGTVAFSDLLEVGSQSNFMVHITTLPNGNPLVYDYTTMLLSDPYGNGYNANSYQAQVNSDGLYPVTEELYTFLKLHAERHSPAVAPEAEYADNAWLAACYYYKALELGSPEYPQEFTQAGTYTIQQSDEDQHYYFTINLAGTANATYRISINTYSVRLYAGSTFYSNTSSALKIQNLCFESGAANSITFHCYDTTYKNRPIELVIEEVVGSFNNPIAIEANGETVVMQPIEIIGTESTKYEVYYAYTITANGTLTLTADTDATIMLGGAELTDGSATVDVVYDAETPENNILKICVVSTNTDAINAILTFTAA